MKPLHALVLILSCSIPAARPQSLAEHARREAERRRQVDEQGVPPKVVSGAGLQRSTDPPKAASNPSPGGKAGGEPSRRSKGRPLSYFRDTMQALDRQARSAEEKLAGLRRKQETERRKRRESGLPSAPTSAAERLRLEIQSLEGKIARLQAERRSVYEAGLREGWYPGELDGRFILR